MGRQGVVVFSRPLRYRHRAVRLPDGTSHAVRTGEEKGIDVRIALDVIAGAHRCAYDVALILSQARICRRWPQHRQGSHRPRVV
ncbi:MAG: NYN domain-containing protein, partial [Gemmatimonadota bacterium]